MTSSRAVNNSELVNQIEEEIRTATRNAYLYAAGITLISCFGVFTFTWAFYIGEELGTKHRIALVSAIYSKVHGTVKDVYLYVLLEISSLVV